MSAQESPNVTLPPSPASGERTSDFYEVDPKLPQRFNRPEWFKGYGVKAAEQHPMYRTTSKSTYGAKPPCPHTMHTKYKGKSQKFSEHLSQGGMYRNDSLHTTVDKKYCDKSMTPLPGQGVPSKKAAPH